MKLVVGSLCWLALAGESAAQPVPAPVPSPAPRWQVDMTPPAPPSAGPATVAPAQVAPAPVAPSGWPPATPAPTALPPSEVAAGSVPPTPTAAPPTTPEPTPPPDKALDPAMGETLPPPPPFRPLLVSKAVPRALFLTVGWTYTPTNSLPLAQTPGDMRPQTQMGINIDGALLWQVRGFDGVSWPAWIGFMPSFYYYFGDGGQNDFLGMGYGIYVKHALWPRQRVRLFFAYGLGATQVWVRNVESRGIGHLTRLAVGMDVHLHKWLQLTFEFSYRFYNLPMLKVAGSEVAGYDFHSLNLQAGFWFGR